MVESEGELLEEEIGRVRWVRFNRPDRLNAFTGDQYVRMNDLLTRVRDDDRVSVVLITGEGRAFSSGDDLSLHDDPELAREASVAFDALMKTLASFDKPLLAAVNGLAIGFGATFLLHCDVVLASTEARLRYPFSEMGVPPEAASSVLLPGLVGPQRAAEILFEADWIDSTRAHEWGLFAHVFPPEKLREESLAMAKRVSERSLFGLQAAKRLLLHERRAQVEAAHARETEAVQALLSNSD